MICQNCLEQADECICKLIKQTTTEFQKLQARWLNKKGTAMPEDIARLPLETIRKAVILVEAGHEVGIPRQAVDVEDYGSSMSDWDGHNNHT